MELAIVCVPVVYNVSELKERWVIASTYLQKFFEGSLAMSLQVAQTDAP